VVEVQIILLFIASIQTIVFTHNPVEVLRIFTKGPLKLQIAFSAMVLFAPLLKINGTPHLKLLVG
jgi:hypothetical protein